MNREILFRIYDTESKRYLTGDYSIGVESGEIRGIYGEKFPALIAEQFTGLLDKHGAPIFEGDILGDWNDIDGVMTQSKVQVFWDSEVGAWALDNSYNQDKSSGDLLSEELALFAYEVVGNIHGGQSCQAAVSGSLPLFKCKCGYETSNSVAWCVHADCCNGNDR